MTYQTTVIRKIKRPAGMMRWSAYVMSKDEYGLWLFSPKGTLVRGQNGSEVAECEVGQGNLSEGMPIMHLIPNTGWWIAAWDPHRKRISIDICTPPTLTNDEWHYIDLELDPRANSDRRVIIEDENEFEDACIAGLIPPNEANQAQTATTEIVEQLRHQTEPFGNLGWNKLKEAMTLSLPPIRALRHISI